MSSPSTAARYGWRVRVADRLLRFGCRHPEGIVCAHRQWLYDHRLRGWHDGNVSGTLHAEAEAQGKPPYEDHPCLRCGRLDCNDINAIITLLGHE